MNVGTIQEMFGKPSKLIFIKNLSNWNFFSVFLELISIAVWECLFVWSFLWITFPTYGYGYHILFEFIQFDFMAAIKEHQQMLIVARNGRLMMILIIHISKRWSHKK